jgi:integration host factor subunit alpha
MRKVDIAAFIARKVPDPDFSVRESLVFVEVVLDSIKDVLREKENVKIPLFGNFVVRQKRARKGRNPKTGEEIGIAPRCVVTFKPSKAFKEFVNP